MSILSIARKGRDLAFSQVKDFVSSISLKDDPTSTYNETTRVNAITYGLEVTVEGVFRTFSQAEIKGEIQPGDAQITINHDDVGQIISPTAQITIGSEKFIVIRVEPKPKANPITQKIHVRGTQ